MIKVTLGIFCFIITGTSLLFAQPVVIDKVIAVVDNEIILQSELDFQISIFASQRGLDPKSPELKKQMHRLS